MTLVALYYQYHYYSDDDDDDDDVVSLFSSTRRELEERNCSRHAELYNLSESCLKVVRLGFKSLPNPFLKPSFKIEVLSTTYYIRTHAQPIANYAVYVVSTWSRLLIKFTQECEAFTSLLYLGCKSL